MIRHQHEIGRNRATVEGIAALKLVNVARAVGSRSEYSITSGGFGERLDHIPSQGIGPVEILLDRELRRFAVHQVGQGQHVAIGKV